MERLDAQEEEKMDTAISDANSSLRAFGEFFETSSIPALPKLVTTDSKLVRLIWISILLLSTGVFVWQAIFLIDQFMQQPVAVSISMKHEKVIDFPSVTICNMNPLRASMLEGTRFQKLVTYDRELAEKDNSSTNRTKRDVEIETHHLEKRQLPTVPTVPTVPTTPTMPTVPTVPTTPTVPTVPTVLPTVPAVPTVPTVLPTVPTVPTIPVVSPPIITPPGDVPPIITLPVGIPLGNTLPGGLDPIITLPVGFPPSNMPSYEELAHMGEQILGGMGSNVKLEQFGGNPMGVVLQEDYSYLENITDENDFRGMMRASKSDDYSDILKLIKVTREEARRYGHLAKDTIATCSFDGFNCNAKAFYMFENKKYGRCYTFNSAATNVTLQTTRFGIQNGLELTLNPQIAEYLGLLAPSKGFRVVVHSQDTKPYPEYFGVNAATGRTTLISIRKNQVERFNGFGGCTHQSGDDFNTKDMSSQTTDRNLPSDDAPGMTQETYGYSLPRCVEDCIQSHLLDMCSCTERMQENVNSSGKCSFLNKKQFACHDDVYKRYNNGSLTCDCRQECDDIYYSTTISSSEWPTDGYSRIVADKLGKRVNGTDLKQLVNVKVYFEELNYQYIEESDGYPVEKLLGDLGGILGLYVGLCVCSIFELFELLIISCQVAWMSMKKRKANKIANGKKKAWDVEMK